VGGLNMRNTRGDRNGHWIEAHGQTPGCWAQLCVRCRRPHPPDHAPAVYVGDGWRQHGGGSAGRRL
jgi:hypothetical protein